MKIEGSIKGSSRVAYRSISAFGDGADVMGCDVIGVVFFVSSQLGK